MQIDVLEPQLVPKLFTGSINADGTCTVCNRHHDDFAHVVDVGHDGNVQETIHSNHSVGSRSQDTSSHACILGSNITLSIKLFLTS